MKMMALMVFQEDNKCRKTSNKDLVMEKNIQIPKERAEDFVISTRSIKEAVKSA